MENFEILFNELYQISKMTYLIGDHVSVSRENVNGQPNTDGGYGFIIELNVIDTTVCIRCTVENIVERNVNVSRVRSSNIASITGLFRTRSSQITQPTMLASPQPLRKVVATVTFVDVSKVSFIVRFSNEKYSHSLTKYLNNWLTKEKAWLQKK